MAQGFTVILPSKDPHEAVFSGQGLRVQWSRGDKITAPNARMSAGDVTISPANLCGHWHVAAAL